MSKASPQVDSVPPLLPASEPPVIAAPAPLAAASPPPLSVQPNRLRNLFALLLSLCLGLFLADAVVSLVENSLNLLFHLQVHSVKIMIEILELKSKNVNLVIELENILLMV